MGDFGGIDIGKCIVYSHDLIEVLKSRKDVKHLMQCLEESRMFQSFCGADFCEVKNLLDDYQKKIDANKQMIDEANRVVLSDEVLDTFVNQLEEEIQKKHSYIEELSAVDEQLSDLERQRVILENRRQTLHKCEKDEARAQRNLAMYASVTTIIPNLDDKTKIAGHIVKKDEKMVDQFEFDPTEASASDICNNLWRMIDQ